MDHSHHDHSMHADHDMGGMPGHGGMEDMCQMSMLFTWETKNLCIIFKSWHIRGPTSLIFSLLAIVVLTAGYELLRNMARNYELRLEAKRQQSGAVDETSSLLPSSTQPEQPGRGTTQTGKDGQFMKAIYYSLQVSYSFFIMLLFMTYNGWVMLAVGVGAFVGYLVWGNTPAAKSVACH